MVLFTQSHSKLSLLVSLLLWSLLSTQLTGQLYKDMISDEQNYTLKEIQIEAEKHFADRDRGRGSGYKQWKRWEYLASRSLRPDGTIRTQAEDLAALQAYNHQFNQNQSLQKSVTCTGDWQAEGPKELEVTSGYNPGLGRITSVGIHASDSSTFIVGAHTGGVWKTTDDGNTWTSLSEEAVNLSVGALEIAPSNPETYYWGTSGGTLFKSSNGGNTWEQLQVEGASWIITIAIDSENEDLVWVADRSTGIYRSEDGGASWVNVGDGIVFDIEFHPTVDSILYASGEGVYRSTDYGESFDLLSNPAPNEVSMMAVTPAAPDHIYLLTSPYGKFGGFYISRDQGETFTQMDDGSQNFLGYSKTGGDESGQAPRDMDISVSPSDSNVIFLSGINVWRSMDAGLNFDIHSHWVYNGSNSELAYTHADIDQTKILNDRLYVASDGGIFIMDGLETAASDSAYRDATLGMDIHQIYRLGLAQSERTLVAVGAQDNGSSILVDGTWRNYYGADGMDCVVMDNLEMTVFGMIQSGGPIKSTDLGMDTDRLFGDGLEEVRGNGAWVTPVAKNGDSILLVGYDAVYRSDDLGDSFTAISQQFLDDPSIVSEIATTASDPDVIIATVEGSAYMTKDGGLTDWVEINPRRAGYITVVAIHPSNPDLIALADDTNNEIHISTDGAETWDIYGDLPRLVPQALEWQDDETNTLYLGMTYGIYTLTLGADWQPFNNKLPNVRISDLEINHVTEQLFASTYGRGLWSSPICRVISSSESLGDYYSLEVFPNPVKGSETITISTDQDLIADIRIYDSKGQVVYKELDVQIDDQGQIQPIDLVSGVYYIRMSNAEGIFTTPLIIN